MFMHIGGDTMVRVQDVIGIFALQDDLTEDTKRFLKEAEAAKNVEVVETGNLKSFVVTTRQIYFSPVSAHTLKKRAVLMDVYEKIEAE